MGLDVAVTVPRILRRAEARPETIGAMAKTAVEPSHFLAILAGVQLRRMTTHG